MSKSECECDCLLCKPVEGKRGHPLYGFDLDLVPATCCLFCKKPIGEEEYLLETGIARFGTMQVLHKRCAPKGFKEKIPNCFKTAGSAR